MNGTYTRGGTGQAERWVISEPKTKPCNNTNLVTFLAECMGQIGCFAKALYPAQTYERGYFSAQLIAKSKPDLDIGEARADIPLAIVFAVKIHFDFGL